MSSASTPVAITNNLVVEGVSAQAPRGLDFVADPEPRLTWRTATDAPDWVQQSAELELTTPSGIQTASVPGSRSVLVDWPFTALAPAGRRPAPGPGHGERRRHLRLERTATHPRRVPGRGGVGRHPDRPGRHRRGRHSPDWPGPSSRSSVTWPPRCSTRPPSGVYQASVNGTRRRRPGAQAGLDAVPVAAHPRDHRRDRPAGPRDQRARDPFRRRLGHRAVRLPRPGRTLLQRPARRGRPAGDHVRGRPPAGGGHRRDLAGLHRADHGQRDLPRRGPRRAARATGLGPPGVRRRRLVRARPPPSRSPPRARGPRRSSAGSRSWPFGR